MVFDEMSCCKVEGPDRGRLGRVIQKESSRWAARLGVLLLACSTSLLACLAYGVARTGPHERTAAGSAEARVSAQLQEA